FTSCASTPSTCPQTGPRDRPNGVLLGPADDGTGVCDNHSRVWNTLVLWVAGNNVIPTATTRNPTLTSVASPFEVPAHSSTIWTRWRSTARRSARAVHAPPELSREGSTSCPLENRSVPPFRDARNQRTSRSEALGGRLQNRHALHVRRHRKDAGLSESRKRPGQSPTMDFPSRVQAPKASNERPQQPPIPPFGRESSPRPAHV
ncbi:GMC oxidoreductase, partial [Streptomyces sp. MH13]|uniref:GMC oxidoreductase n=1 Tax=Streptomyces sp. MH13 TaxID=3417651 RepID=UPI003CED60D2